MMDTENDLADDFETYLDFGKLIVNNSDQGIKITSTKSPKLFFFAPEPFLSKGLLTISDFSYPSEDVRHATLCLEHIYAAIGLSANARYWRFTNILPRSPGQERASKDEIDAKLGSISKLLNEALATFNLEVTQSKLVEDIEKIDAIIETVSQKST